MTFNLFDPTALFRVIHNKARAPHISANKANKTVRLFLMRARQRRQLLALSEYALKDIGVTRSEAIMEANKPFWKA